MKTRRLGLLFAAGLAVLALSIPVLAASPSPSASSDPSATGDPSASAEPSNSSEPSNGEPSKAPESSKAPEQSETPEATQVPPVSERPDRTNEPEAPNKAEAPDAAETPEVPITLTGTVQKVTDANEHVTYTMLVGGKTWTLSAGPPWFWGDKNPLNAAVGKSVTIAGGQEGDAEVDVDTIDGKAVREPGKPPWAGGPWVVGPTHPGWKSWMAEGKPGKGHGRESAPGQLKQASPTP